MKFMKICFSLLLVMCSSSILAAEDLMIDFFEGYVEIVSHNNESTRFIINSNSAVIDVYNSVHQRLDIDPYNPPKKFKILAPTTAIKLVEGVLPSGEVIKYPMSYYIKISKSHEEKYGNITSDVKPKLIFTFTKDQLDKLFTGTIETWKEIARDMKNKSGVNVRVIDKGNEFIIHNEMAQGGFYIAVTFNESKQVETFTYTMYFPSGTLTPEKKQVYQQSHNTKVLEVEPEYETLIKFSESNIRDYLEFKTTRIKDRDKIFNKTSLYLNQLRKKAEKGDREAQFDLGVSYLKGEDFLVDPEEAFKWFMKAAEQNDAEAQYYLGEMSLSGTGVRKDQGKALGWFEKSAIQGNINAQYNLGRIYYELKNLPEAKKWLLLAAKQGDSDAQKILTSMGVNASE